MIYCCNFSSFYRPDDLDQFFTTFGPLWRSGDYHRTEVTLNEALKPVFGASLFTKLKSSYSMKALNMNHVPFNVRVYGPTSASKTQLMVFPAVSMDQSPSPAVLGKCGKGSVGYLEDLIHEEGSQMLLTVIMHRSLSNR